MASVLAAGNVSPSVPPFLALIAAGAIGAAFGVVVGLPALRLRTFYFAITTLGFSTIVTQVALAWQSVTGGGDRRAGPAIARALQHAMGLLLLCLGIAALICTWMTLNIAHSRYGRVARSGSRC